MSNIISDNNDNCDNASLPIMDCSDSRQHADSNRDLMYAVQGVEPRISIAQLIIFHDVGVPS